MASHFQSNMEFERIISNDLTHTLIIMNYGVLCTTISLFGIISNVINIIIFTKQGLQNTVNISLLGLSISDFCALVTCMWTGICFIPELQKTDIIFQLTEVQYLTGDYPHCFFARISGWITALIMFERFLCIMSPFKVKSMITPNRIKLSIFLIYILTFLSILPVYFSAYLDWKFYPESNRTLLGLVLIESRGDAEDISSIFMNSAGLGLSMIVILGSTIGLVFKLTQQSTWRKSFVRTVPEDDGTSIKDRRVIKMMVMISMIYIFCFMPISLIVVWMFIEPEFILTGRYENIYNVSVSTAYTLEAVSSSVNIFIYYQMSSRYRSTFLSTLCCRSISETPGEQSQNISTSQPALKRPSYSAGQK